MILILNFDACAFLQYSYLNAVNWDELMGTDQVNTCWTNFEEKLKEARDKFVPSYRICSNRKKVRPLWMNSECRKPSR